MLSTTKKRQYSKLQLGVALVSLVLQPLMPQAAFAASSNRPQIVIAIGNSQSMDGDLSGAIMTGSGNLTSGLTSLYNSSSPQQYSVPAGFTPPMTPSQTASAPYTYNNSGTLVDNGASRLNVAKAGISSVLNQYLPSIDFALEDYSTSGKSLYTTWVYYMSPNNGFAFANSLPTNGFTSYAAYQSFVASNPSATPTPTRWVSNPCYQYGSASSSVKSYCTSLSQAGLYGASASAAASTLSGNQYMQIAASSDDPNINDVLYASGQPGLFVDYGGAYAAYNYTTNLGPITSTNTPYTYFNIGDYNNGVVSVGYNQATPSANKVTGPTNAGYVPYSPQVVYAQRGFGYYVSSLSATSGTTVVSMTNLGSNPSTTAVNSAMTPFTTALQPETNSSSSTEIKALAYQSPTAGLIQGAGNILKNLTASCAGQYVILVTDGLPTMDLNKKNWPPLGSASGQGYGVNAAFYGVAGNSNFGINDDSGNLPSGQTLGALDISNTNDQALIDTINAIKTLNQNGIKTYVVGLGAGVDPTANPAAYYALNAMAIAGGTSQEYPANNPSAFVSALQGIVAAIQGNVLSAAPVAPSYVQNGSLAYALASNTLNGTQQGYFYAYSTDATGTVSSSPAWQLSMTAQQRKIALYTDQGNGTAPILFTNTPSSAFNSTNPTPQTIINYTIDPSYNSGAYLAGRANGSFLGTITSQADKPVILSRPNNPYFITSSTYQQFAQKNALRTPLVLFTANDGFLYAVSGGTASSQGTLQWAWMPSTLLSQLQNYGTFQSTVPMNGGLRTVDSADGSGKWATYVVGTGQSGALHYDLKLTGCGSSTSACTPSISNVWFDSQSGATSPPTTAPQAPVIWWDANGVAYAYYFTTSGSKSYVNVMRLYDGSTSKASLSFTPSSAATVDVLGGKLYVGDTGGNVWSFDLTAGTTANSLTATQVGAVANATSAGPVRYVGIGQTANGYYLWATTDHEVNAFKFTGGAVASSTSGWTLWWWSTTNGSGYFNGTTMTTTTSDPGVTSTTAPYWLDANSTITDASVVENNTLVVPVTVSSAANGCGPSTAKYDFFNLDSGVFPQNRFYLQNGNLLTSNPIIGYGTAFSPVTSENSNGSGVIYGSAQQNPQQQIGFQVAATTGIHVGSGVMGWQPLWMTQP
jgi:type IV pilus assembly protein PilY1